MDKAEAKERVRGIMLASEVIGRPLSAEAAMLYVGDTADMTAETFAAGLDKARRQCRFMPSPDEFRELAGVRRCRVQPLAPRSKK